MKTLSFADRGAGAEFDLPEVRLSLFDSVDPWLERCRCSDLLALYLHNRPIAILGGSPFDLSSLNQLLFHLRQRPSKASVSRLPLVRPLQFFADA
jgi:hypothetical protein